uniref:Uncharacterized protein n=1 Tax=Rhodosorus marinus TaxID=101924 RepID=A0A7S3EIX6_9RHOD|mmetsp:Transcript_39588/g.157175  ORF Transcript_39588/g.157175 Transcript_39588/m.157175 type:complete len:116 (+) Transcript_39588:377-724(+)
MISAGVLCCQGGSDRRFLPHRRYCRARTIPCANASTVLFISRESEISTLRFEAAQEKIQKSELEFIIKSLKVDIEEDRSRAEKSEAYTQQLEEQVESYKTELEEVNGYCEQQAQN